MAVRMNQEAGGFKLLEEDALDDRPCAAVKKFVSSVLDRKDMKDQDVASSFRNLMEYRDSTSSPSACSVATSASALDGDRLNSPPSPSSPTTAPGPMDDQRLPNELLDEICEDIGMKEGMELDFVEYLMEQDANPQLYMTQEAISSGAFNSAAGSTISTPTGSASGGSNSGSATGSHASNNNNNNNNDSNKTLTLLNPPSTTTPNFLFKPNFNDGDWLNQLPSPLIHSSSGQSSGTTTVQSSENNSPANKRIHLSVSTDTSPNKGRSQTPPGFNQHPNYMGNNGTPNNNQNLFKIPQPGPLMAKRSHSYPQGAPVSSPVQSTHSNSSQGSNMSNNSHGTSSYSRPQEFSMNPPPSGQPSDSSDQEDNGSTNNKKVPCVSPKPILPTPSCDFPKPSSPSQNQANQSQGQGQFTVGSRDGSVFQRVGKQPPPPNVNVKSMQQQQNQPQMPSQQQQQHRWMGPPQKPGPHPVPGSYFNKGMYHNGPFGAHHHHHQNMGHGHMGMAGPPGPHNAPVRTPVDSPLDQGYFSNESAGNCSNGSAPSPAFTSSSMSSFSSINTMMPADPSRGYTQKSSIMQPPQQQQQQDGSGMQNSRPAGQKSVHFADMPEGSPPAYPQNLSSVSMDMKPPTDCAFEMESNGQPKSMQSGKILPRFNHSMKSGVAPYTVPNSQGQVMGSSGPPGYDFNNRSSCAMGGSSNPSSPSDSVQEFMNKSQPINGSNNSFYMDGNQNMMRMDSMQEFPPPPPPPPPLMPQQTGEYGGMPQGQPGYRMDQFSSMQQQQPSPHPQQSSHRPPSSDAMPPPPPHPHIQQPHHHHQQQQQQQQPQQFSSCSHSSQGMGPEYSPNQNSMQISNNGSPANFQIPLAMSTPMPNRSGSNVRMGGAYGPHMGPPSYENSYGQGTPPDMYPPQQPQRPHQGQTMMPNQQAPSMRWGPGPHPMPGNEELQVQVGGMHPAPSPMKGGLQPPHPQGLPHMQPSPTPACAAPMGPGPHMQDMNMMNSGVHMNSGMGPSHPHMGPHPDYGPCIGMNCNACKMGPAGTQQGPHPHMGPCMGPNCHTCKMSHPSGPPPLTHMGPCTGPNCTACKMNQANRPQMLSSQQKFIQHLIMDEGNSAYRSHPLFPLLRDLVIAEMNFDNPRFHYQQLLSLLPNDFHKLLQNFLHRNPPSGHYQSNQAVESVIMDSLRLAHSNLVDKIRHRQELEKMKANSSASLRSMEEFCQKFDHSVNGPMGRPVPNGVGTMGLGHPMGGYDGGYIQPGLGHMGQYRGMKDGPDMLGETTLAAASPQANKTESKKHPSLPKEAVAMMMEWLRNHKDNPYPNDDEKAMLIKQTGLSINQINYWFTNARRRILPKWAQCKT